MSVTQESRAPIWFPAAPAAHASNTSRWTGSRESLPGIAPT